MSKQSVREAFDEAFGRYSNGAVGTPLQEDYRLEWPEPKVVSAETFWGQPIDVTLPELVSCEIHRYGLIEPSLTALFIDRVTPASVFFDVGAHLGYYSMLATHLGAEVHAFEPSKATLATLRKNLGKHVHLIAKGAWRSEGMLELKDFGSEHSAVNTFVSSRDEDLEEPDTSYPVSVTSIDRHVAETGAVPDLIKIDAEGAELEVLRGATTTLMEARPMVTIEVGDTETKKHSRAAIEYAQDLGYSPFDVGIEELRPHTIRENYGYGNIVLIAQ